MKDLNFKKVFTNNMILKEIRRNLNVKEKILLHIFTKSFVKIYKKGIEKGFNSRM